MLFGKKRIEKMLDMENTERKQRAIASEFEKGDFIAILIAAFITLWPALLVVVGLISLLFFFA